MNLKEFSGNPLEWTSDPGLSNVDNMNYLKGLLKGEALKVIAICHCHRFT